MYNVDTVRIGGSSRSTDFVYKSRTYHVLKNVILWKSTQIR